MLANNQSAVKHSRFFSTEFKDHERLLHKFARGGFARLESAGICLDYEDAFQEVCVSYIKAKEKYKPESGIGFSAYLGRSVINNFNAFAGKVCDEHFGLGLISVEDLPSDDVNDSGNHDPFERLHPDCESSLEDRVIALEAARENIGKLSSKHVEGKGKATDGMARLVIRDLIKPSLEVVAHHKAEMAHSEHARSLGEFYHRIPQTITLRYLAKYHGIPYAEFVREIQEKMGIDLS